MFLLLTGNKVKEGKTFQFWGLCEDFQSVVVVGLGKKSKQRDDLELICEEKETARIAAAAGCRVLSASDIKTIHVESFGDAAASAEGSTLSTYKFQEYKTKKSPLPQVSLFTSTPEEPTQWERGTITASAQNLARKLKDTPSNLMTPTIFAETVLQLATPLDISVQIRDKQWAEREKMGGVLAVAQGSNEPLRFLELSYKKSDSDPFVLVGKGVTFDSGGISIKPSAGMDEMRGDMGGAASVVAAVYGLARLGVATHVKVLVPLVENMPSGGAIKPGDVITTRSGKTVCVDNTDAEGRLILADALSYSGVFKPRWVLDIATLTGAIRVALGGAACGVFSNSNALYEGLEEAGSRTGDRMWRMPLWKYYTKMVAENTAYDVNNLGKGKGRGGSCTAAAFLKEFIPEKTDWLHIDMAGVMGQDEYFTYLGKGMSGRPTRTLIDFIEAQSTKTGNKVKEGKTFQFWGLCEDFQSVVVVGLGKKSKQRDDLELICEEKETARIAAAAGCRVLSASDIKNIHVESFGDAASSAEGSTLSTYKFQEYKTKKSPLPQVSLFTSAPEERTQWERGTITASAQNLARKLKDTPSNLMTPTIFAETVLQLATPLDISVQIRDKQWAEREKMGGVLAVAQGSNEPLRFLELSYKKSDCDPFVLVGKGVTFDSGGISIKPSAGMDEMRGDMGGAASVVAAVYGLARLGVATHVKVLVPLVENMPSGGAIKPGDVITTRSGKTVCVDNTDAEGRLILADALSYSGVFKPRWVLDIATLTGAIRVALGGAACGVFSNSNALYEGLEEAGSRTGDRMWRMPLWKYYTKMVAENTAYDVNNLGKGKGRGGSCTAAAFLKEFIPEKTDWVHIDMAGVMGQDEYFTYLGKGMSGRPTRTLIDFIEAQSTK
ncbi:hypothetical protein Zmor_013370 [Zophobas morio]|uniref:Cytosol aminopeptidase n=1 Tax=Zophobas morio TaxID=2755281 RepID=A0AA38MFJ0_9CUCU|nr:hypothetical protein Zmor_013370 [Zophobas morio]